MLDFDVRSTPTLLVKSLRLCNSNKKYRIWDARVVTITSQSSVVAASAAAASGRGRTWGFLSWPGASRGAGGRVLASPPGDGSASRPAAEPVALES